MFVFFFFKQKTAYEMRISDWSSDVCSSDLRNLDEAFLRRIHAVVEFPAPDARCRLEIWRRVFPAGVRPPEDADLRLVAEALDLTGGLIRNIALDAGLRAHHEARDRKSGVEGKRVAVGGDRGGRRKIKTT